MAEAARAARAALARIEPDDVPAKLKRIAGYQGGRLPRPLYVSLLEAVAEQEWLREKAATELGSDGSDVQLGAARLFLDRPDGWEFELGKLVGAFHAGSAPDRTNELVQQLEKAEKREARARERLEAHVEELGETRRLARAEADELRAELRALKDLDRSHDEAFEARVQSLEAANAAAEEAIEEANRALRRMESRAKKAESGRAEAERRLQAEPSRFDADDPIAIARHLDAITASARSIVEDRPKPPEAEETAPPPPFRLPAGARPDHSNSVEWLSRQPRPFTVIADGYNLTHRISPDDPVSGTARERLNEHLARFKLVSRTPVQVIVVYDSNLNPDTEDEPGPGGVLVRFTHTGMSADDEIRALAASLTEPAVVISSDREVREAAEDAGAIGLWSEAFAQWVRRR